MGEIGVGENAGCVDGVGWEGLQGGVGLKRNADAGESVDAVEELGVEREAEVGKRQELGWSVRVGGSEHTCGGVGGFGEGRVAIEHRDSEAAAVQLKLEGEADDAGAGDADVGMLHETSLFG